MTSAARLESEWSLPVFSVLTKCSARHCTFKYLPHGNVSDFLCYAHAQTAYHAIARVSRTHPCRPQRSHSSKSEWSTTVFNVVAGSSAHRCTAEPQAHEKFSGLPCFSSITKTCHARATVSRAHSGDIMSHERCPKGNTHQRHRPIRQTDAHVELPRGVLHMQSSLA